MALDIVARKIETLRENASAEVNYYRRTRVNIEQDRNLSPEGKRAHILPLQDNLKTKLADMQAQEMKLLTDKMESLQSSLITKLGSSSSDIIAMRDAEERADRLENQEEAVRVIQRAVRSGDKSLAHAVLRRGMDSGWSDVVAIATEAYPDAAQIISDIAEVDRALNGLDFITHRAMAYNIGF